MNRVLKPCVINDRNKIDRAEKISELAAVWNLRNETSQNIHT